MKNFIIINLMVVGILIILAQQLAFAQYYQIHHTTLILKPIPRIVQQGYRLTFSGTLFASDDKMPIPNSTVLIEHDSPYEYTRILASTTTDNNGNFAVSWTARLKGVSDCTYNLFAKFNGDDNDFYSISNQFLLYVTQGSVKSIPGPVTSEQNIIILGGNPR
jgi:hypothetical protein